MSFPFLPYSMLNISICIVPNLKNFLVICDLRYGHNKFVSQNASIIQLILYPNNYAFFNIFVIVIIQNAYA